MTDSYAPDLDGVPAAIHGCVEAVERCRALVDIVEEREGAGDTGLYAVFGPHFRHCIDHFRCLLRGVEDGVVDYDARDRDVGIEHDPGRFRDALDAVLGDLRSLDPSDLDLPLQVRQAAAPNGSRAASSSNLERELAFVSGHTIHHLAIMIVLASERGTPVPEELGVAYSTAAFRRSRTEPQPNR